MTPRWTVWLALVLLASRTDHGTGEIVEASTVTNVVVGTAAGWDLTGCGVGGCDPRLTRDGEDNTVPASRWSCSLSLAATVGSSKACTLAFTMDDYLMIDHVLLYLHESDTQEISIPFTLGTTAGLTTPGLALGVGQRVNVKEETSSLSLFFDLTNDQYINLSEVEIFVNVEDTAEIIVAPPEELFVVDARTVTNVVATAEYWNLNTDAGCGDAGCMPGLATDGQDNTVAASRWSCTVEDSYDASVYFASSAHEGQRCDLVLTMDDDHVVSHVVVYLHNGDDATKEAQTFIVRDENGYGFNVPIVTTPGTELGTGERFNMPRRSTETVSLIPTNVTAGQVIEISEVEIYVEVTKTSVPISAVVAWTEVLADSITTVASYSSESLVGFAAAATRDGDDNTVAASRWSCDGTGEEGYCELRFEFNDEYPVSHLDLYMHESANANKEAVPVEICSCHSGESNCCGGIYGESIGSYVTKPGTPLGEPERVNVLLPETQAIGILAYNLTVVGGTVGISEVDIYLLVPDATPTPAPFQSPAPSPPPTYSFEKSYYDDGSSVGGSSVGNDPVDLSDDGSIGRSFDDDADDGSIGRNLDDDAVADFGDDGSVGDDDSPALVDADDSSGIDALLEEAAENGAGTRFSAGSIFCVAVAAAAAAIGGNSLC